MGILKKFTKKKEDKTAKEEDVLSAEEKKTETKKKSSAKKTAKKTDKTESETPAKKVTLRSGSNAHKVLIRPYVSEKAAIAETHGTYTFEVAPNTNKIEIKKAIKDVYGVMPTKVRVMNFEGKRVRFGRKMGRRKDWKKAVVILPKGKSINIHEGV